MILKSLELVGFKSFAEKTVIQFEKGFTCIVGPNGCGKSNISDAIHWVLGERSAKLLRGRSMGDVIFNGSEVRKALDFAEVSLTIDNADHKLPIGYEEVVISRRVYRSGESEYFINRTRCRYKDIQQLTLDTGIGSNSYSMVEQGRIDWMLSASEEDRRSLIEEAAGIAKYKVNKEEALRKLERTEENLLRLNDIVTEVERNIRYAERQAKRAERYKEKLEQLKKAEIAKAFLEIESLKDQNSTKETERQRLTQEMSELSKELDRFRGDTEAGENRLRAFEEGTRGLEHRVYEIQLALAQGKEKILSCEDRIRELTEENQRLEDDISQGQRRLGALRSEQEEKRRQFGVLEQEKKDEDGLVRSYREKLTYLKTLISQKSSVLTALQVEVMDLARRITEIRNQKAGVEIRVASEGNLKDRVLQDLEKARAKSLSLEERNSDLDREAADVQAACRETEMSLESLSLRKQSVVEQYEQAKEQVSLQELALQQAEGAKAQAKAAEEEIKKAFNELGIRWHGGVEEVIQGARIQPGYEWAIQALLQDALGKVIVDRYENAFAVLNWLNGYPAEETSFLVQEGAPIDSINFTWIRATDCVEVKEDQRKVLESLLGDAWVVEKIDSGNVHNFLPWMRRARFASRDGIVLGRGPIVRSLKMNGNGKETGETQQIEKLRQDLTQRGQDLREVDREIEGFEKGLLEHRSHLQSVRELKNTAVSSDLKKISEEISLLEGEVQEREGVSREFRERIAAFSEELSGWVVKQEAKEATLKNLDGELRALLAEEHEVTRLCYEQEASLGKALERQSSIQEALKILQRNWEEEEALTGRNRNLIESNQRRLRQFEDEKRGKGEEKVTLAKAFEEAEAERMRFLAEKEIFDRERQESLKGYEGKEKQFDELEHLRHQIELDAMELRHQIQRIHDRIGESYRIVWDALDKNDFRSQNKTVEALTKDIEELRTYIDSFGAVNLLAIEEFESLKERYEFLMGQKRDLEQAREGLREAIRKINRTTRTLFSETLIRVRTNFREYFRVLFGGGDADIVLVDEDEPLESGIQIRVRVPGKAIQELSLLSGGEKALGSIALMFALFKVKPSAFCVLDEIDAPLDEANTSRFLTVVKGFLDSTQFIVVTHNRKTMAACDTIFGVTMEEPGVSKLVSVKWTSESGNGFSPSRLVKAEAN